MRFECPHKNDFYLQTKYFTIWVFRKWLSFIQNFVFDHFKLNYVCMVIFPPKGIYWNWYVLFRMNYSYNFIQISTTLITCHIIHNLRLIPLFGNTFVITWKFWHCIWCTTRYEDSYYILQCIQIFFVRIIW